MKFVIFTFIAVLGSCPYKLTRASDTTGTSQPTETTTGQTTPGTQGTGGSTPSVQTTTTGRNGHTTQAATPATGTTPAAESGAATGNSVTLDINKSNTTNDSEYSKEGDYRTYTAKDNKSFSKIVKNKNDIWESKDKDEAVKVVLKGSGDKKKHLVILLKSNKFVLLYKEAKNKPWNDITSKRHDTSKLKFYAENDKEMTSSDYEVTILEHYYSIKFRDSVSCRKIKLGGEDIWKSTDDKNFESIRALTLDLESDCFYVLKSETEHKKLDVKKSTTKSATPTSGGQSATTTATTARTGSGNTTTNATTVTTGAKSTPATTPRAGSAATTTTTGATTTTTPATTTPSRGQTKSTPAITTNA
ncbi:hypothetical protein TpMuguga_04g00101 [Theileria parva strain Muguga]|uniref:SfiI-subtelomeric related protein family member n=1 Tax=Theileria parva TaxID=5875 RepID=Q4N386_THEPA|nr:uncharacterized protein TpMuguga_04g00101 [Theileria parva strain Muguga]EAN31453.1 hypothetical protein TpMuguga_04g00101 [Theileria parva strain Muguga]|eukprot:XP_763736.1 hypothetical protein [Theileria parva strain Muguga]